MALTTQSLGLARKNIKDVFLVAEKEQDPQWKELISKQESTTQVYETYKQLAGLAPAEQTPEGEPAKYDDLYQLFTKNFTPVMFTKALKYSKLMDFTNQYKDVIDKQKLFALAFTAKKNQYTANLHNLGFTNTTYGMNNEALYSTTHSMASDGGSSVTGSNRPAVDIAFGPLAVEQMLIEIRKQKSARGIPLPITGKSVKILLPPDLEPLGVRVIKSLNLQGTNNNDTNEFIRRKTEMFVCDYFTSTTAWFGMVAGYPLPNTFFLQQMPYDIEQLAMTDDFMHRWVSSESYTVGWQDWHGTWGSVGA